MGLWRTLSIIFAALALFGEAYASPWGRAEGEVFLLSRIDQYRAMGNFLDTADPSDVSVFERIENTTYGEYGLNRGLMIGGKLLLAQSVL